MASSDNEGISQLPGAEASYLDQENLHFGEDFRRRADFLAIAQDRAKIRRNRLKSMVPRAAANAGIPMNDLRNRKFNGTLRNLLHPNASASRPNIPKTPTDYRNLMAESAADTAKDRQYKRFGRFFRSARDAEGSINSIAAELGELAAVTYLERRIADEGADRHIYVSPPGNEKFDVVAVIHGKLVIIEAKGGASKLGTSRVQDDRGVWHKVRQGSPMYLRYILRKDAGFRDWLKNHPDKAVRDLSNKLEAGQALDTEYHQMQAPIVQGRNGKSRVGVVTRRRLDTGGNLVTMVNEPPSTKKPRKTRPRRARARVVTVASAAAIAVPAVTAVASDADASPPTDALPDGHGVSPGQANNTSSSDGVLSFLKTKAAEFGRMLSSFKDHVTNGLNALVTMVGDAVSKVSDFVSGVIDSVGAQGVIDEAAQIWAVGQDLINYAMLLSPVGSVAEALTVAIMVIQGLVDHWDQIRAGFDWALKNVLIPVADFFKTAFRVYITPYRVVFDLVMAGFNGMGGVVGSAVSTVQSVVAGIVMAIGGIFQKLEIHIPSVLGFGGGDFGLKPVGDAMVNWASARMADGGVVRARGAGGVVRSSGIHVMAVIDQSVVRAAQDERRKVGFAYRPPFLHDGALARSSAGVGSRTIDLRVPDVDSAFAQIKLLQARHDMRLESAGV